MFVEPQKPPIIFDLPPKKRYRPDPNLDTNMKIARANRPYYADSLFGCFLFLGSVFPVRVSATILSPVPGSAR
jgi:hypothetical protein